MSEPLPDVMTCIEISRPGGPEVLTPVERPVPVPESGEVLIRVAAAGVNGPDVYQRQGAYPPPPGITDIPGLEIAGTVVAAAADVTAPRVGERVCALVAGGGYAEYCPAPAPQCLPVPAVLNMAEAAAVPETFFTVWTNVFERGRLAPGETLLVHGGGGGIGTTAVQVASRLGARVLTTAGGPDKCRRLEEMGAERAIDYHTEDFVAVVKEVTGRKGVDVILDMIGGDYVARNIACLTADGRMVSIAFRHGSKVTVDLMPVMLKRLTLTGSTLRMRPVAQKGAIAAALKDKVWPLLERGEIRPPVSARIPLREAAEAHRLMESGTHFGKIVLVSDTI